MNESADDPVANQVKAGIRKHIKCLTSQPFIFLEISSVKSLELYYVTTRSVQEKKILTYRSFQDFYTEKQKAFKYNPDCLLLDESAGFDVSFLVLSKRNYFVTSSGGFYRYKMLF